MKSYIQWAFAAMLVAGTAAFTSCSSNDDEPNKDNGGTTPQPEPEIANNYTITSVSGTSSKQDIKSAFASTDDINKTETIALGTAEVSSPDDLSNGDFTMQITFPSTITSEQSFKAGDKGYAAYLIDHKNKKYASLKTGTLLVEADKKDATKTHVKFRIVMDDDAIVEGEYDGQLTSADVIDILPATNSFALTSQGTTDSRKIISVDFQETEEQYKFGFNFDEYLSPFDFYLPVLKINKDLLNQRNIDLKTTKGWELNYIGYQAHDEKDPQWAPANTDGKLSIIRKSDGTYRISYTGVTKQQYGPEQSFTLSYEGEVKKR